MNRNGIHILTFFLLVLITTMTAWGDVQAKRIVTGRVNSYFLPETQITVSIYVTGDPGSVTVIEQPPVDWMITQVQNEGVITDGQIIWNLSGFTGNQTLQYFLMPPAPADAAQDGIFFRQSE